MKCNLQLLIIKNYECQLWKNLLFGSYFKLIERLFSSSRYVLGSFDLLRLCWCLEWVSLWVMISWSSPLRGASLSPIALCFSWTQSPLVWQPDVMGTSLAGIGFLGWEVQCGAETPHCSVGTSKAEIFLPGLNLHPSYQSRHGFFFLLLVIGILFS